MHKQLIPWSVLVAAGVLLGGCQDRREPVKPTVGPAAATVPAAR